MATAALLFAAASPSPVRPIFIHATSLVTAVPNFYSLILLTAVPHFYPFVAAIIFYKTLEYCVYNYDPPASSSRPLSLPNLSAREPWPKMEHLRFEALPTSTYLFPLRPLPWSLPPPSLSNATSSPFVLVPFTPQMPPLQPSLQPPPSSPPPPPPCNTTSGPSYPALSCPPMHLPSPSLPPSPSSLLPPMPCNETSWPSDPVPSPPPMPPVSPFPPPPPTCNLAPSANCASWFQPFIICALLCVVLFIACVSCFLFLIALPINDILVRMNSNAATLASTLMHTNSAMHHLLFLHLATEGIMPYIRKLCTTALLASPFVFLVLLYQGSLSLVKMATELGRARAAFTVGYRNHLSEYDSLLYYTDSAHVVIKTVIAPMIDLMMFVLLGCGAFILMVAASYFIFISLPKIWLSMHQSQSSHPSHPDPALLAPALAVPPSALPRPTNLLPLALRQLTKSHHPFHPPSDTSAPDHSSPSPPPRAPTNPCPPDLTHAHLPGHALQPSHTSPAPQPLTQATSDPAHPAPPSSANSQSAPPPAPPMLRLPQDTRLPPSPPSVLPPHAHTKAGQAPRAVTPPGQPALFPAPPALPKYELPQFASAIALPRPSGPVGPWCTPHTSIGIKRYQPSQLQQLRPVDSDMLASIAISYLSGGPRTRHNTHHVALYASGFCVASHSHLDTSDGTAVCVFAHACVTQLRAYPANSAISLYVDGRIRSFSLISLRLRADDFARLLRENIESEPGPPLLLARSLPRTIPQTANALWRRARRVFACLVRKRRGPPPPPVPRTAATLLIVRFSAQLLVVIRPGVLALADDPRCSYVRTPTAASAHSPSPPALGRFTSPFDRVLRSFAGCLASALRRISPRLILALLLVVSFLLLIAGLPPNPGPTPDSPSIGSQILRDVEEPDASGPGPPGAPTGPPPCCGTPSGSHR